MAGLPHACGSPGRCMLCGVTGRAACVSSMAGGVPRLLCLPTKAQAAKPRVQDQATVFGQRISLPCLEIIPFP